METENPHSMEIKGIKNRFFPPSHIEKGKNPSPGEFEKVLRESRAHHAGEPPPSSGAHGVESAIPPAPADRPEVLPFEPYPPFPPGSVEAAEHALDLLERYQKSLADPRVSLRDLQPLAQSLEGNIGDLTKGVEVLSATDPLALILSEIKMLAAVQVEKFRRGDYV